ncbi:hypothetical protein PF003_g21294 [Phytophthora fragariae]|nr:hypothetical protein PF003_g21294 [Phytophthora fragariae]
MRLHLISGPRRASSNADARPEDVLHRYLQPGVALEAGYADYPFMSEEDKGIPLTEY